MLRLGAKTELRFDFPSGSIASFPLDVERFSDNHFGSRGDPERSPGLIPERSRSWLRMIPTRFGIRSGSRRLSPLDFGIKKNIFCVSQFETSKELKVFASEHLAPISS
jgi:hypothetical protein